MAKPLISSPVIARRASRMDQVNMALLVRDSAVKAGAVLVNPLKDAARRAGGSATMVSAIKVHDGHLNELVMRDRGQRGDVIVGVDGSSKAAGEAEDLEWGGLDSHPAAWVRTTAAQQARVVTDAWSAELTKSLDKKCR